MHHHELHQENRKKAIEKEKSRILSNIVRRPKVKSFIELQREERARKKEINNSLSLARDRVYARRVRSRSRWNELTENQVNT
jgi:Zn-dependent oligopeptidase